MTTTKPLSLGRNAPGSIEALNAPIVRISGALSFFAAVIFGIVGQVTGQPALMIQAWASLGVAALAGLQVMLHREHAPTLLAVAAAVIAIAAISAGNDVALAATGAALAVIGMGGALFIRGNRWTFLGLYAAFIVVTALALYDDPALALVQGALLAVVFVFGSSVLLWLLDRVQLEGQRFTHLFTSAPVSIWEEDFSQAAAWLRELRSEGVDDLEAFLDQNPELVRQAVSKVRVNAVNNAAVDLLEADSHEQLMGGLDPQSDAGLASLHQQLIAMWNGETEITLEIINARTLKGNRLDGLLSWSAPIRGGKPDFAHVLVAIVDVAASREAQEQLEQLIKSKNELVATVSHELRTPLTAVVGLSQELRDAFSLFEPAEAVELVRLVAEQSLEVSTIVEDLLAAAQADAGNLHVTMEPVDLRHEAEITLKGLGDELRIPLETPPALGTVMADPGRVRQIIRNLIVNAQRYGGTGIRAVVHEDTWMAKIEIRDNGAALPADQQEAIFDRYYRSRQTPGITASVGLGLTVSRELARVMGGDLTYHHDGEAVFTIVFPLATAPATAVRPATPTR